MRVASLESVLTAATLVLAIVIVLWGIKIFHGVWAGVLASNWKPPVKRGSRQRRHFRGGGGLFISCCRRMVFPEAGRFRRVSSLVYGLARIPHGPRKLLSDPIGFKSRMHFGYYLMIAALVLMGLEVLYALYHLATFL
jgi:hypothetical protein